MDESLASSQTHECAVAVMKQSIENEEEVVSTIDSDSPTSKQKHKYATLISNYEDVNEKLRRELAELKNRETKSDIIENSEETEKATRELAELQNLLEERNKAFVASSLEAALWYKATSMFEMKSTTRMLLKGVLKLHRTGLAKLKKNTWVEISVSAGRALKNEYKAGYVTLTYADSKNAGSFNQCKVIEVFVRESSSKNSTFTARVSSEGREKELIFGCETEFQRNEWMNCITNALTEVREAYNSEIKNYTLKLEFSKEKIGLLIKERYLDKADERSDEESEIFEMKHEKSGQCAEKETMKAIEKEMKEEEEARPCKLFVIEIVDKDLKNSDLQVDCIVEAINDTVLVGKVCLEQLNLLAETPKPYVLTFTGINFKKKYAPLKSLPKHLSILKELVAYGNNEVKEAFSVMVRRTVFEKELMSSEDKNKTVSELLGNQRRLIDLLQNFAGKEQEEEQVFKE